MVQQNILQSQCTRQGQSISWICAGDQTRQINLEFNMCMVKQGLVVLSVPSMIVATQMIYSSAVEQL